MQKFFSVIALDDTGTTAAELKAIVISSGKSYCLLYHKTKVHSTCHEKDSLGLTLARIVITLQHMPSYVNMDIRCGKLSFTPDFQELFSNFPFPVGF